MMNWWRVSSVAGLLVVGVVAAGAYVYQSSTSLPVPSAELPPLVEIPHKDFSPTEHRAIQETFWLTIQGKDRECAESFVFSYMETLRRRCEIRGDAKNIGGGCGHMTNAMDYPHVLEAGLRHCGINYSSHGPRPNNSFKPTPLRGAA